MPELEEALDALQVAEAYCEENDYEGLGYVCAQVYQALGRDELGMPE